MELSTSISIASFALSVVAIVVTIWLARLAEKSLRKSTKITAYATGQVLRSLHYSQRPDDDEIINVSAPYWGMKPTEYLIEPGGSVELEVLQQATDPNPLYSPEESIVDPGWVVLTPYGRIFKATAKHQELAGGRYLWSVKFPTDFVDAQSSDEGLYTVECSVPDRNYKRLFTSFFVLK
jgi:hypothetical protein